MKIISIPHPTLRQKAKPVKRVDKKFKKLHAEIQKTLAKTKNPKGVGLAAPQVDKSLALFATLLPDEEGGPVKSRVFINPKIIDRATKQILGETATSKDKRLEGCLSMPGIYGAVPRWEWTVFHYQELVGDELIEKKEHFKDFPARVMQHELDHLEGILFTDYSLELDLPVYLENKHGELEEIDKAVLNSI